MIDLTDEALLDDVAAWTRHPKHRWVYDKLAVAEITGVPSAPLGVEPPAGMRLVVKPIVNLFGMSRGARAVEPGEALPFEPGMMWQARLDGPHYSVDVWRPADGAYPVWSACSLGVPGDRFGRFSAWIYHPRRMDEIEGRARAWVHRHLAGYTGPVNLEIIGERIIEVHLRLTRDWIESGVYAPLAAPMCRSATLIPEWSDDPSAGDNGRVGYRVEVTP